MAISLLKELKQNQKLSLTPQLRKSIDLLQLSRFELIQKMHYRGKWLAWSLRRPCIFKSDASGSEFALFQSIPPSQTMDLNSPSSSSLCFISNNILHKQISQEAWKGITHTSKRLFSLESLKKSFDLRQAIPLLFQKQ